jgi:hypothetical protein
MSRAGVVLSVACIGCVAACSKLVEAVASPPNRDAAAVVLENVPDTLLVGDTAGVFANVNAQDGKPAQTDTAVTWTSSNTAVVSLDASRLPIPTPHGFRWLYGKGAGQATVTAQTTKVSASKVVTVLGPADIGAEDRRFGYALADQPSLAGPYAPGADYRLNSSGGAITITRDSTGWYNVRFAGLGRKVNQRDNVQVTAYGSPPGVHCKLLSWPTNGADLIVPVHCHQVGGAAADSRFTVLLSGARAYDLTTPFAFAERTPQSGQFFVLDTSATSFNSVSAHIIMGKAGIGVYNFGFSGFESFSGPQSFFATGVNASSDHCRIGNYVLSAGPQAACLTADGAAAEGRVSVMLFTRGRVGHRYAYASTNNLVSATPPVDPTLTFNSSGGSVTSRRLAAGRWTVTFAGLGRPAGATEIVIVSALKETDHLCSIASWGNTGVADLTVTLQCFDPTGTAADARFSLLVVE